MTAFAAFLRLYHIPDRSFGNDVWLWTIGINLHSLPFFNIGAHVTENFFESLICTPYGWADTLPTYIFSGAYNILKIPLSEYWIYFMHVFFCLASIALIFSVGRALFNNATGLISAFLLAFLPIDITAFGSGLYYHHSFLMFIQLCLVSSFIYYERSHRRPAAILFFLSLIMVSGTEALTVLPVIFVVQAVLEYRNRNFKYLFMWIPAALLIALNLCLSIAFRESNLCMFGYTCGKYMSAVSLKGLFLSAANQLKMLYTYFYGPYLLLIAVLLISFYYYHARRRGGLNLPYVWWVSTLLSWFLFVFAINVYLGQGFEAMTFRYSHYFLPLILISGFATSFALERARSGRLIFIAICLVLAAFFAYDALSVLKTVLGRKVYTDNLKAASCYIRENGGSGSTVFQLIPLSDDRNYRSEYYFGKSFMEPPAWTGFQRQLFSLGDHPIDEYKKAYALKEFDFYIDYAGDNVDGDSYMCTRGLNRIADIRRDGKPVAAIYSPHRIKYQLLDAGELDRMWDKKYANLDKLLQNRWVGLAVLRGYHHRID